MISNMTWIANKDSRSVVLSKLQVSFRLKSEIKRFNPCSRPFSRQYYLIADSGQKGSHAIFSCFD